MSSGRSAAAEVAIWAVFVSLFAGAGVLARYNLRLGQGDRSGARRLAILVVCLSILSGMLRAHHVPVAVAELEWLLFTAGLALLWRGFAWLVYNVINGLPTTLTMYGNHGARNPFQMNTTAFYAEEQWTGGRLTLQGGLRYEQIGSY